MFPKLGSSCESNSSPDIPMSLSSPGLLKESYIGMTKTRVALGTSASCLLSLDPLLPSAADPRFPLCCHFPVSFFLSIPMLTLSPWDVQWPVPRKGIWPSQCHQKEQREFSQAWPALQYPTSQIHWIPPSMQCSRTRKYFGKLSLALGLYVAHTAKCVQDGWGLCRTTRKKEYFISLMCMDNLIIYVK